MDNIDLAEYQTLIQTEFKDVNNKEWRVTIGKYVANKLTEPSVTEMAASLAGNPVNIQWEEKDIDDPIHGSRLTLNLLSNYDRKFIDFYTVSSNGLKCTLSYKDDLGNYIDYWQGALDTESYEEPFSRQEMYTVSLSFTDFAPLARAKYSYTGFLTVREFIYKAFRKYLYTNTTLSNVVDWSSTVIEGQSILDTQILSDNFYDEDGDGMSIYDVLSSILLPLGLHMIQKNGNFYIYDVNSLVDKSTTQLDLRRADAVLSTGVIYNNIKLNYDSNEDPIILSGEIEENAFVDEDKDKYEIHTTVGRGGYTNYIWFLNSSSQYINGTDDIDLFGSRTVTRNGTTYNLTPAVFDVNQDTSNGNIENSICVKAEKYSGGTWTAIAGSPVGILSTPIIYPIVSLKNGGFFSRVTDEEVPVDIGTSTSRSILTATRVKISVKVFASYLFDFLKNDDDTNKEDDATEFDGEVYEPAYMKVPARVRLKDADGNVIVHAMGTTWIDGDYADTDDDWTYMTAYDSKSKVIDNWADVTATLSIPPNNSGWLHIEIGNRIEIVTYSNGRNLYSDNDLMDKCHWVFVKDIAINAVDEFSKSQEVEDYSIEATVDEEASEVLSIDTMMGSAINLTHTAKGAYFKDGDYCTNFSRHGVAATVEYLYLRTLYAAYATRHAKVTTTAVLVKEPNPCTISTLSGKFVIVGETQDIAMSRSELTLLEGNKDSTDDIEVSEIVGTSTIASTSTVTVRDGANGSDAVAPESIYRVSKYSVYPAPESVDVDNYLPSGWHATPQSVNPVAQFGFVSTRKKVNGIWGEFSTPAIIARWAADGTNGTDGVGVSETVITYAMSSSGTIAPSAGWQTDVPTLVAGNFLWTRTHWTYTDDSEKTGYSVSHIGTDGTNGNDGQSITSLTPQFIRTTSNTTVPTGTWLDTPPTWLDGTYIWTRNKIIYVNPAATVYTIAIVDEARNRAAAAQAAADEAKQAVDAVEIGGRNLIAQSQARTEATTERDWVAPMYKLSQVLEVGVTYTFKCHSFSGNSTLARLSLRTGATDVAPVYIKPDGTATFVNTKENVDGFYIYFSSVGVTYTIGNIKLEKGNKATDWTPAPEDDKAYVDAMKEAAIIDAGINADGKITISEAKIKTAYESYTNAAKAAAISEANTHADGKVTDAEAALTTAYTNLVNAEKQKAIDTANAYADDKISDEEQARLDADEVITTAYTTAVNAAKDAAIQEANAAADGKITDSEAKVTTAYKSYADAAKSAAETTAKAYADGIVTDEENRAIQDATTKANDAKQAAITAAAADAQQAIDAVEIGGRNLILDSENRIRFWSNSSSYPIHDESVDGVNYRRFKRIFTDGVTSTALSTYTNQMFTPLESGYYTLSIHFKPELYDISLRISLNTTYGEYKICKKSEWTRLKVIAYLEKDIEVRLFGVRGHMSEENEQWVNYNRYKLEKGNKATDWTPAPEDVEADAQAKADAAELAATQVANNAQAAADAAQAEAANKSKTFNSIPTTPYHIGDLFVDGSDLRRCVVERLTGSYNATDWGAATNYDNTTVVINEGVVTAGSIQVGGDSGFIKAGMTGDGTADDSVRFFAGDTFTNRNTAPFRVYQSGKTVQTDGVFSGRIDATSGSIGGFEIGDGHIGKTDGSQGLYFNSNAISLRKDGISTHISTGGYLIPAVILENHSVQSFTENTCMSISCKNSTKGNVALDVKAGQFRNFNMPIRVVTSNTTLTINDTYIVCNSTSNITITLPNLPIEQDGHVYYIKQCTSSRVVITPAYGIDIFDAHGNLGSDTLDSKGTTRFYIWSYSLQQYLGSKMI